MSQDFRLDKIGLINRDKKISFKFNGKSYFGYEGDTLASALIANGVHLVGRSFKYHRPRGFFGSGVDEPYAIVQLYRNKETDPNVRATEQELFEGLEATSVNCWPNVNFDIGAINNFLNKFFPAGFYYKTFMWPKSFWYKVYEPFIRKAAGFGVASVKHDKERYEHKYEYCDLLITGSGPSGLASAYAAAKNGARVILAEDKPRFGGSLLTSEVTIGNQSGKEWANSIITELKEMPNVIVKNRAQVFGYYDHNMLVMSERINDHLPKSKKYSPKQRLWYIRAKEVVISSGSIERPLVFGNNDTPGVILSSAAKEYLKVYGVLVGRNPLIFTNNDSAYETAIEFKKNGIWPIVLDTRSNPDSEIIDEAKRMGINIKFSYVVIAAKGYKKVKSAEIAKISEDKKDLGQIENINCDCICVSGFWTPTIHLASQSGNKTKFNKEIDAFVPSQPKQKETTIGSANGVFTLEETLKTSFEAGYELSKKITNNDNKISVPQVAEKKSTQHDKFWCVPLPKGKKYKRFLDFQNDVAVTDIELALREGYRSIEHVKRYTTLGMATDQGKTSNLNGLQLVSNIEIKNLNKEYNNILAVRNVNFTINKGSIVGLLGPNGCGKTTTIGMMLGLIKPTSGTVFINGKNIENENNRTKILEKVNFISPYVELPKKLTVEENLKVYGKLYGVNNLQDKISDLMNQLNLFEFKKRKTGELSSGQKNRVSLAKALINEPEILFLDEPTASLDPDVGDFIRTYIEDFASKKGTTILLASHNMNEVERLCNEVMMMKNGEIIDKGTCNDLIKKHGRKNLEETFLKIVRE